MMGVITVAGDAALMVVDSNGVIVEWSQQAEELAGRTAEEAVGQPLAHLVARVTARAGRAAGAGHADVLVPGMDGHAVGDLRLRPVPHPDGSVAWAVFQSAREGATFPGEQAAAGQQAGSDAGRQHTAMRVRHQVRAWIGQTLDVVAVCRELADSVVPDIADVAAVEVVEAVIRGEDPPLAPLGREVPLRRAAFRYCDGEAQIQGHPLCDLHRLPFPSPYAQALTDLKPRVIDLKPDLLWLAADSERAAVIRACGVRTLIAMPLTLRGTVLGLLSIYSTEQAVSFDERDMDGVATLAVAAAVAIDRARLYTREHTVAATVQRGLLPAGPVSQTGIETACGQVFGEAGGGGWCDAFTLARARTALVVGEVSGQGLYAAATMGQLRTAIRSLARLDLEPDELLARLNDTAVLLAAERAALPPSSPGNQEPLTASCVYAIYDPLAQTCTYARAQHPAPVIVSPGGAPAEVPDVSAGPPLGTADGLPFTAVTISLDPGGILALYTRSILPVAPSGDPDDPGPLRQIVAHTQRPLQDLCDEVIYAQPADTRTGDAVLGLARTATFPSSHVGTWSFGPVPESAAKARANVRRMLADWNIDEETAQTTELIISELVANAIRYGDPPMWLRVIKDLTISCEVHDGSPVIPYLRHPGTLDEFGRGLLIIGRLVTAWGTRRISDGKTVWADVPIPPNP